MYKEEQIPILLKLFPQTEVLGALSNSFYEATWYQNQTRTIHKWKIASKSDEHRRKTLQNISKLISTKYEKDHTPWSSEIYPRRQEWFNIHKQLNVIHHINKRKTKNDMIISVNTEECIWQHSISIYDKNSHQKKKTFIKVSIEGTYLNIIKTIYDKPTANIKQTFCLFLLPSAAAGTPIKPCLNFLSGL